MSDPYISPQLFDLPGDCRPRRIFRAYGDKRIPGTKSRKATRTIDVWVNSPTRTIATRTARRFLAKLGYKQTHVIEHTWREYAVVLRRAGFGIEGLDNRGQ